MNLSIIVPVYNSEKILPLLIKSIYDNLKESKISYEIILVNSNPATIMTDPIMADATYIEPIQKDVIHKIIKKEKPDAILPTMGGQTALNVTLELHNDGILEKENIEIIGGKP